MIALVREPTTSAEAAQQMRKGDPFGPSPFEARPSAEHLRVTEPGAERAKKPG
jgi:hypothetical protein